MAARAVASMQPTRVRPARARLAPVRPAAAGPPRYGAGPVRVASPAQVLALQSSAGNRAVQTLLDRSSAQSRPPGRGAPTLDLRGATGPRPSGGRCAPVIARPARPTAPTLTVSRCGPDNPGCACSEEERLAAASVQRRDIFEGLLPPDPFAAPKPMLRFTNRIILDGSLPTVCPRCHRETPTVPMPDRYVDRDATEDRLVSWGQDATKVLHHEGTVRALQLDPDGVDRVVEDYGVGLTKRITSSHEFEGTDALRAEGADTVRRRWQDIRAPVRAELVEYYQKELVTAVGSTPKYARPLLDPATLRSTLTTHVGGKAPLGRMGLWAEPGQRFGIFDIYDINGPIITFSQPGRPVWLYRISSFDFVRHDPFLAEVSRQVYDNTRWILIATPMIMKAAAFGLSFSGSVAFVILGIALDELATEMQADAEGRPGRPVDEILTSAATQLLLDRLFHHLLGAGPGASAGGVAAKTAAHAERIAERAAPLVRKEIATAEKPLVKDALEAGTGRRLTDATAKAEGHTVEVTVTSAGETHLYRLGREGTWCRFSAAVCGLDLGADVAAAAASPKSFTQTALADARALIDQIGGELSFLDQIYQRMRAAGKVDLALLSKEERALLDDLVPSGDASTLTLAQLRDLPRTLGLKKDLAKAAEAETRLVKQLYEEGRPLYETLRVASPSAKARSKVLGEAYGRDAVTNRAPRSGRLHVDHVVPVNDIVRMPGFDKLRPERQLEIVDDVRNLRAIDSMANGSKSDWGFSDWPQAAIHYGPEELARMRTLEAELRTYLAERIRVLSRP